MKAVQSAAQMSTGVWGGGTRDQVCASFKLGESCTQAGSHLTITRAKNVGKTDIKAITVPNLTGVYSVAWLEQ